ncbi:MAG TPA: serine/threonine-protein kinase [Polyangiaceae bacterium]|jgi:serine/threonine-protein kinase
MAELPEPGTLFADKYVIESRLGGGAAGVVLSAMHKELRQRVAIKVLRDSGPVSSERMIREARAAIALHSEHVVRVMDVGRAGGSVFLVMEQLEGSDLASVLKKRGPLPIAEAVDYVLQACAGIAEAHARGVVHRDLKPSNLFLTKRADGSPLVKVLDFGISKSSEAEQEMETSLTGPADVLGSPMYMSPEQVRGAKGVDHRTDIWALGVIVFRLASGKAPFGAGMTVGSALASVVADEPASLREVLPDAPKELEAIVTRCLEKMPGERFATVAELAAALAPFGTDDGRAAVVRLVREAGAGAGKKRKKKGRWGLLVVAGVVLVGGPAVAFGVLHRGNGATATATASTVSGTSPSPSTSTSSTSTPTPTSTSTPTSTPTPTPTPTSTSTLTHRPAPLPRPHPTGNSSVVKSAATNDRY